MARRGGRGNGKDAKAQDQAQAQLKAQRRAAPTRPKQPKRERFSAKDDAHKREADRQIKLARAAPHNLDTQPDIVALITDETEKLGQNPLFYGETERANGLRC